MLPAGKAGGAFKAPPAIILYEKFYLLYILQNSKFYLLFLYYLYSLLYKF